MFLVEILILVVGQIAEHSAGLHIVTVDDKVGRQGIHTALIIEKQAAVFILTTIESTVEIIGLVLGGPHDRIVDIGIRDLQPCSHVAVGCEAVGIRIGNAVELFCGNGCFFCHGFCGNGSDSLCGFRRSICTVFGNCRGT